MNQENKVGFFVILFFALYVILPSYFALEISDSLPLITGSRIILVLLVISYIIKRKGKINLHIFEDRRFGQSIKIYFTLLILTNISYITITSESIKQIFIILVEELGVLWIISKFIDTKEKLIKCLEIMVVSSAIVAFISIISVIINVNFFYYLNTVSRTMLMASYARLGFTRAEAGFGHPVYYAAYNVIIIPIIMYLIENKKKSLKYMICLILDIGAMIFANSRGSLVVFIIMLIYMFWRKEKCYFRKYLNFIVIAFLGLSVLMCIKPQILRLFGNIYTSVKNIFVSDSVTIENYGRNSAGLESRIAQLSQVTWAFSQNPLFGLGAGAQNRGVLKWFNPYIKAWQGINTFDVGYFAIFCQYGIVGSIGYLILYFAIVTRVFGKKYKNEDRLLQMFKYVFVSYFLCMLSITGVNSLFWVMLALLIAYTNTITLERNDSQ